MKLLTLPQLRQSFSGTIIEPQDPGHEQASKVLVRQGSPAIILACANADDVALAVRYARGTRLVISVRSGGHSNAGLSTNDGGIIIDVSHMNEISVVDTATHRVRIGAGAQWGNIARELHKSGLAISSGDTVSVGASGLLLGGGIGWMVRKHGLAIDSLQSANVVTAEGELLIVDEQSHPDLFWAIRGGGGNFGVVTVFELTAHPVGDVYAGNITYAPDDPAALFKGWRDYMRSAPDDLTTIALLAPPMGEDMPPMFMISVCWNGDDAAAAKAAIDPLRALPGTITRDDVRQKHYYEVLEEAHVPQGVHIEVNNAFFHSMDDKLIERIVEGYTKNKMMFQVRSVSGAMNHVPADATAFAHRGSEVMVLAPRFFPQDITETQIQAALEPWYEIAHTSQGAYVNFFSRATPREVAAAYPPKTLARLAAIKHRYDPDNIFSQNLNIKPAA